MTFRDLGYRIEFGSVEVTSYNSTFLSCYFHIPHNVVMHMMPGCTFFSCCFYSEPKK
jgi:hypothetical protein